MDSFPVAYVWLIVGIACAVLVRAMFLRQKHFVSYNNIIGDTAYVGSGGITRKKGEVTWSGTIMKARLADDAKVEALDGGSAVTIVDIKGVTLLVAPE